MDFYLSGNEIGKELTEREMEVLDLVLEGKSNNEIADELVITIHTAKAHVSSIIQKFKVKSRLDVVIKVFKIILRRGLKQP